MKSIFVRFFAAALLCTLLAAVLPAQLRTKKALTLEAARKIAAAAEQFAVKNKLSLAITILDDGGHLLYFQKMDGVQIASIEISARKAESALNFRRPSKAMADRALKEPHVIALPGAFPFEGGLPLAAGDDIIGAIGISGATSAEDAQAAQAGVDVLAKMTQP